MGRRKIEIKAIKDDRNRSVTFLKRKGGLFKKAHELSVLCSVNVAVIIFGHNGKLYEFSSGDINDTIARYQSYGHPHEHKGPADYNGKKDYDDDDEDDAGSPPPEAVSEHDHAMYAHHLQNQAPYQHMREYTPSQSPPMPNGAFHPRGLTPQPHGLPRPDSRTHIRRSSSNLVPQHHPGSQPPTNQNGFAYMPNPPLYNPQAAQNMHMAGQAGHPPQYQYQPPPPQQQPQQVYMEERRQQSMPPAAPPQHTEPHREPSPPHHQPEYETPQMLQPKPAPPKSKSIFTPIDDSRSLLAQQWGLGTSNTDYQSREREQPVKTEFTNRSQSVDVGAVSRHKDGPLPLASRANRTSTQSQRNASTASLSDIPRGVAGGPQGGDKRPRLKVQIPSEQSDGGSATADSSPRASGGTALGTPVKTSAPGDSHSSHSSGVVLPPPSPSASAILSAGAQGPPNPFARPIVPSNASGNVNGTGNQQDTPISALPSRFVDNGLLPSPSSFYPDWGFSGRPGDNNVLPSPLNFQTPIVGSGPSFLREDEGGSKRKTPERDGVDAGPNKRVKA